MIHSVLDVCSGRHDHCTPGGRFIVRGRGFGDTPEAAAPTLLCGVYIHGSEVSVQRIVRYESWRDREIRGWWPQEVGSPLWLFVERRQADGQVISALHCVPVTPIGIPGME